MLKRTVNPDDTRTLTVLVGAPEGLNNWLRLYTKDVLSAAQAHVSASQQLRPPAFPHNSWTDVSFFVDIHQYWYAADGRSSRLAKPTAIIVRNPQSGLTTAGRDRRNGEQYEYSIRNKNLTRMYQSHPFHNHN